MNADSISELLLTLIAGTLAVRQSRERPAFALACTLIALTALVGAVRFAGYAAARGPHEFFSVLSASAGLPLLAIALRWPQDATARRRAAAARLALFAGGIAVAFSAAGVNVVRQLLPLLALLLIFSTRSVYRNAHSLAGALLLLVAMALALSGGSTPYALGPLSSRQWLHYALAAALSLLSLARVSPASASATHGPLPR